MYMTYATIIPMLLYLLIAVALAVSAIRLIWITGNYLKCRQAQLPERPASKA